LFSFFILTLKSHNILPSLWVSFLSSFHSLCLISPSQFVNKKHLFISILQMLTQHYNNKQFSKAQVAYAIDHKIWVSVNCITYRIILNIPISVASVERSFSKLKLLKSNLRSTMSQDILNSLALISFENNFVKNHDFERIIDDFATKNSTRKIFK